MSKHLMLQDLTPQQVADKWQVSSTMVTKLLRSGQLKGFRIGTCWRIRSEDMLDYEAAHMAELRPDSSGSRQVVTQIV